MRQILKVCDENISELWRGWKVYSLARMPLIRPFGAPGGELPRSGKRGHPGVSPRRGKADPYILDFAHDRFIAKLIGYL